MAQGEREAKNITEQEQAELVDQWVATKMKAFQPRLSNTQALTMKICPKCRKKHAGVDEELAAENGHHDHGSSHDSPEQPRTSAVAERIALEVEPVKNTATIIISSVIV